MMDAVDLPFWLEIVVIAASVVTAVWVLWTKAIQPTVHALSLVERVTPMLAYLVDQFPDAVAFQRWVADSAEQKQEFSARLARIERVIDYEHPPPRDWSWTDGGNPGREYERRSRDVGAPNRRRPSTPDDTP